MDRVLLRNFLIFTVLTVLCFGIVGYMLLSSDREIDRSDNWVLHTNTVIVSAEQLSTLIEGMMSAQHGYLLTGDKKFLSEYDIKKAGVSQRLADLRELTADNQSQIGRLEEIRSHFNLLIAMLDQRNVTTPRLQIDPLFMKSVESINAAKLDLMRLSRAMLKEEYSLLSRRVQEVEVRKDRYFRTLLIGGLISMTLLLLLNAFLLRAQSGRTQSEKSLKESEDRFSLAIQGTNDGIYDWDLKNGSVFFSKQFSGMLGHERGAFTGTMNDFKSVIHPDDTEKVSSYLDHYMNGEVSEFAITFRARSAADGRWIWLHSRAKALYDDKGRPIRLVGANTDITYLKRYEERLREEKEEAQKANRAKTEFLAHMSHEIRTPLTAISGIAEIFDRHSDKLDDRQKQLIRTLHSSTSTLKDLVNDILDFSKIESGELSLDEKEFDPYELFAQVTSIMAIEASEKGLEFKFDSDSLNVYRLIGDPLRLRQILINLIGNAIKFTHQGRVLVRVYREDGDEREDLRIDVADTGIGIDPESRDVVFEQFKQGDSSVSRKYGGTGLGLSISRNLARLMGGNIVLESTPGKGSCFSLIIPFRGIERDNETGEEIVIENAPASEREDRILMVEDYEGNIVVLSCILDDLHYHYDVARTGAEALALWKQNHYAVILMDIQMPEMDGFSATQEIRALEAQMTLPRTPIVGMTAHALVGDRDKCIASGMDAYLPKPIVEADLKARLEEYVNRDPDNAAA